MCSVWNFYISNIDNQIIENIVAVMWNSGFPTKMLSFSPTIFICCSSLWGHFSRLSHQFYTYPTPIRQIFLIGTSILDTKLSTNVWAQPIIATIFNFQSVFPAKMLFFSPQFSFVVQVCEHTSQDFHTNYLVEKSDFQLDSSV